MSKLKEIRESRGMTQGEVAEKLGLSISAISKMENGILDPKLSTAKAVANALGVTVDELCGGGANGHESNCS